MLDKTIVKSIVAMGSLYFGLSSAPELALAEEQVANGAAVNATESRELPPSLQRVFGGTVSYPSLEDDGVDLYLLAMNDTFVNTTGGIHRGGGTMGNVYIGLTLDTEKLGLWSGGSAYLEGIGVYGRRPSSLVGDFQYASCIDAPETFEPSQFYYEHKFFDEKLSWLVGIHDLTLDFAMLPYGWDFVHSAPWTPSTITQNWWSFYPTTGPGTRIRYDFSETGYAMAGVYDGNPTDQLNPGKVRWDLSKEDGAHSVYEIGVSQQEEGQRPYKLALGGWYNSGRFEGPDGRDVHVNSGTYLIGQALLFASDDSYERGLGAFFQIGQADKSRSFISWYFGAGLDYRGAFESRPEDVLGFAWGRAQMSSLYRETYPGIETNEQFYEITYRAVLAPYLTVQPAIQYIVNPGPFEEYDNSLLLFLRTEILL